MSSEVGKIEQLTLTNPSYAEYLAKLQRIGLGTALTDADVRRIIREELERLGLQEADEHG